MKKTLYLMTVMAALAGEAAITYRGRLVPSSRPNAATTFSGGAERNMKFRIYDGDGNASCTIERKNVSIAPDGTFNVVLDSAELTEKVKDGTAVSVGLSIGNAPEIQPRRQLLPLTRVAHATVADGLARDAKVGMLKANALVCDTLKADGELMLQKIVSAEPGRTLDRIAYRLDVGKDQSVTLVRGDENSVFGRCQQVVKEGEGKGKYSQNPGALLCCAPADGVATIRCLRVSMYSDVLPKYINWPSFSIVRFCRKGEEIRVPKESDWYYSSWLSRDESRGDPIKGTFAVDFHPFIDGVSYK